MAILNVMVYLVCSPDTMPYPDEDDNPLIVEMTRYCETSGINDPLTKVREYCRMLTKVFAMARKY
jgi:hypothetical protein